MGLTRRLFTRAAVAAPVVAKHAAVAQAESLAAFKAVAPLAGSGIATQPMPGGGGNSSITLVVKAMRLGLVDRETVLRSIERDAGQEWLDADLAVNVSMSLTAKLRIQRRRRAERELQAEEESLFDVYHLSRQFKNLFDTET